MGIWLLIYSLPATDRERYLDWFHHTHVDEKLAREGYHWAAHYVESPTAQPATGHEQKQTQRYIAMFGSHSTRAFYDPSPKQLKPKQDALTREMIGLRQQPYSLITSAEWRYPQQPVEQQTETKVATATAIDAKAITLCLFAKDSDDQDIGAFTAQQQFVQLENQSIAAYKLITSSGAPRHLSLAEFSSCQAAAESSDTNNTNNHSALTTCETIVAENILFKRSPS